MTLVLIGLAVVVALVLVVFKPWEQHGQDREAPADGPLVAILGDATRSGFCDGLVKAGCRAQTVASQDAEERSALLAGASACVIVVDASNGPLPIHREDILLAHQFCRGPVTIGFSTTDRIDDEDLLALEELEMREVLNTYALPGDTAEVFFDSPKARTRLPRGLGAAAKVLNRVRRLGENEGSARVVSNARAEIYGLVPEEAFTPDQVTTLVSGRYEAVFGASTAGLAMRLDAPLAPGERGLATISLDRSVQVGPRRQFVLVRDHHVIAAGALVS